MRLATISKYRARRTAVDGIIFHSKKEAHRYEELKLLQQAGEIEKLATQPRYPIMVNGQKICDYIGDFFYIEPPGTLNFIVEDVKGYKTPVFKIKQKLFEAIYGDDYTLRIT